MSQNHTLKIHVAGYGIKKTHKYCIVIPEIKKAHSVLYQGKSFGHRNKQRKKKAIAFKNCIINCDITP